MLYYDCWSLSTCSSEIKAEIFCIYLSFFERLLQMKKIKNSLEIYRYAESSQFLSKRL